MLGRAHPRGWRVAVAIIVVGTLPATIHNGHSMPKPTPPTPHLLEFIHTWLPFDEAVSYCNATGRQLAFPSIYTNAEINSVIPEDIPHTEVHTYWLGAESSSYGVWSTVDNALLPLYLYNWRTGYPTPYTGRMCLRANRWEDMTWENMACGAKNVFVCAHNHRLPEYTPQYPMIFTGFATLTTIPSILTGFGISICIMYVGTNSSVLHLVLFLLVVQGAGAYAYHRVPELYSFQHMMDVVGVYLLYGCGFLPAMLVYVTKQCNVIIRRPVSWVYLLPCTNALVIILCYEPIREANRTVIVVLGAVCLVCGGCIRYSPLCAVHENTYYTARLAILETCLLSMIFAWSIHFRMMEYHPSNFSHGLWHVGSAFVHAVWVLYLLQADVGALKNEHRIVDTLARCIVMCAGLVLYVCGPSAHVSNAIMYTLFGAVVIIVTYSSVCCAWKTRICDELRAPKHDSPRRRDWRIPPRMQVDI